MIPRDLLQPLPIRPVPGDDDFERGVERRRLEQEIDPLGAVEPIHGENEVAVFVAAELQRLRRMGQHIGA